MKQATERQHQGEAAARRRETRRYGFRPAFFDFATQRLYLSRFADGRLAPVHLLDGLPDEAVVDRAASGRVLTPRASLVAGFERDGDFYTREAAAKVLAGLL